MSPRRSTALDSARTFAAWVGGPVLAVGCGNPASNAAEHGASQDASGTAEGAAASDSDGAVDADASATASEAESAATTDGGADENDDSGSAATTGTDCDAQLAIDPHHCGACGHDCLGGACTGGVCDPVELHSGFSFFDAKRGNNFAIDEEFVYFTHHVCDAGAAGAITTLRRIAKDGGDATDLAQSTVANETFISSVSADADAVHYLQTATLDPAHGRHVALPKAGGDPSILAEGLGFTTELRLHGDAAYSFAAPNWPTESQIRRTTLDGADSQALAVVDVDAFGGAVVVDDEFVYFSVGLPQIHRVAKGGGAPELLVDDGGFGGIFGLAIDDDAVYWTSIAEMGMNYLDVMDGRVRRLDQATLEVTDLAAEEDHPVGIVADAGVVYYLTRTSLRRLDDQAAAPVVVATTGAPTYGSHELALDDAAVYWIDREPGICVNSYVGHVMKVAR